MMTMMTTKPELTWVLCTCTQLESEHYDFDDSVLITFTGIDTWPVDAPFPLFNHNTIRNFVFKVSKRKRNCRCKRGRATMLQNLNVHVQATLADSSPEASIDKIN